MSGTITGKELMDDAQLVKDQLDDGNTAGAQADMQKFETDFQGADSSLQQDYSKELGAAQNGVNSTGDGSFDKKATNDAMNFADPNGSSQGSELAGTASPSSSNNGQGILQELEQLLEGNSAQESKSPSSNTAPSGDSPLSNSDAEQNPLSSMLSSLVGDMESKLKGFASELSDMLPLQNLQNLMGARHSTDA